MDRCLALALGAEVSFGAKTGRAGSTGSVWGACGLDVRLLDAEPFELVDLEKRPVWDWSLRAESIHRGKRCRGSWIPGGVPCNECDFDLLGCPVPKQ